MAHSVLRLPWLSKHLKSSTYVSSKDWKIIHKECLLVRSFYGEFSRQPVRDEIWNAFAKSVFHHSRGGCVRRHNVLEKRPTLT
jgi:hypothetical protein